MLKSGDLRSQRAVSPSERGAKPEKDLEQLLQQYLIDGRNGGFNKHITRAIVISKCSTIKGFEQLGEQTKQ